MAYQLRLSREKADRLNDKVVEMLLADEDPGEIIKLLDTAIIEDE